MFRRTPDPPAPSYYPVGTEGSRLNKMVVKLSANTLSWSQEFAAGNMTLLDMIEECYNLRLDGVSPAQPHFASTDDEYLEEVKQAAIRRGLHFDYIGVSTNHAQLGEDREANIANLKKWIDVAAKMGIPMCRTFGGWLREGTHSQRVASGFPTLG